MKNYRRVASARNKKRYKNALAMPEALEAKLPLDASGLTGNDCAPDLDFTNLAVQTAQADQEFSIDLFTAGATVSDLNADDSPSGDTVVLQLDPDDNPAGATLTADGQFTWTPPVDAQGRFEFIVLAVDGGSPALADAEVFAIDIDVPTTNTAPNLADIADVNATLNQEVVVTLTATDAESGNLTFQIDPETQPLSAIGATLEQNGNTATLRWTPDSSFAGQSVDFIALVQDDGSPALSDSERFTINISNIVAAADTYAAADGSLTINAAAGVLANDVGSTGASFTATIVNQPANGTVNLASDGSFTYSADSGFRGTDSFSYQVDDGNGNASIGDVTINVNATPTAVSDSYVTDEDTPLNIDAATGVLTNDTDADGDTLTATIVQSPSTGTFVLNDNGSFSYTPSPDASGDVTFTYTATDGTLTSAEATVTISITPVNDTPVATDDAYSAAEEVELGVSIVDGVLSNDTDVEGDSLTVTLVTDVANGTLNLSNDGSFTYTSDDNFAGDDSFTYTVSDGTSTSNEATVTLTVSGENDPPIALSNDYTTLEGQILTVNAADGVLNNDSDIDGDTLTARAVSTPVKGSVVFNDDGSFVYTPDPGESGQDGFQYRASDGTADSNIANVTIIITAVNDAPVATSDTYNVLEDETLTTDAATGVLANDTDPDNDNLTAVLADPPTEGQLILNSDGSFEYEPSQNSSGSTTFTYRVSDGTLQSDPATVVTINVTTANDAPVAMNDSYEVAFDGTLNEGAASGVLANDGDVDSSALTVALVTDVINGTLVLSDDGSFTYEPDAGFTGDDSFEYSVTDGDKTDQATVNITVTGTNEFTVSSAATAGTLVGSVIPMTSNPSVYQFLDNSLDTNLQLDETDHLSGPATAPVVLVEYLDFTCPACAAAHPVIEQMKQDFPNDLLVVQRHRLITGNPNNLPAARVAEAAARQGKFDEMVDQLFTNQSDWSSLPDPQAKFNEFATAINLDMTQFASDFADTALADRVTDDNDVGENQLNVTGTPTLFLQGNRLNISLTETNLRNEIQSEVDTNLDTYTLNRETGELQVRDNTNITDETISILVIDDVGNAETISVAITAQAASASGVASSNIEAAFAGEPDWLI